MNNRYPRVLTTVEEDFRKIGLLPPLSEADDASKPRDIPSPAPETKSGLDDSEGEKKAHSATASQPKPKMGPEGDSGMDPCDDGGSKGAQKGGGSHKPGDMREMAEYQKAKKQPMSGKKGKKGEKAQVAQGLKPVKKLAGMKAEGTLARAASLIEEVETLLYGVQVDEELDTLLTGFRLVSEDAALLADRLTEISDVFEVEEMVAEMEELSRDAHEALSVIESGSIELHDVGDDEEENAAIANSGSVASKENYEEVDDLDEEDEKKKSDRDPNKPYDIPSPAFKEQAELVFKAMVSKLMDALEAYDDALDENGMDMDGGMSDEMDAYDDSMAFETDGDDFDDAEAYEADQDEPDDVDHDDMDHGDDDDQDDQDDGSDDGYDADQGDDDGMDPDDDADQGNDLMARMKALRARKEAQRGNSFRGADEGDY